MKNKLQVIAFESELTIADFASYTQTTSANVNARIKKYPKGNLTYFIEFAKFFGHELKISFKRID